MGGGWSSPCLGRFTPGKDMVPRCIGGWRAPGPLWETSPPPAFDPWTVEHVSSRYTDYAIPARQLVCMDVNGISLF